MLLLQSQTALWRKTLRLLLPRHLHTEPQGDVVRHLCEAAPRSGVLLLLARGVARGATTPTLECFTVDLAVMNCRSVRDAAGTAVETPRFETERVPAALVQQCSKS